MLTDLPAVSPIWRPLLVSLGLHLLAFLVLKDSVQLPMDVGGGPPVGIRATIAATRVPAMPPSRTAGGGQPLMPPPKKFASAAGGKKTAIISPDVAVWTVGLAAAAGVFAQMPQATVATSEAVERVPVEESARRESISADGLRQYRLALAREAKRFKRYPPLAREQGWQGTVEITVSVNDNGIALPQVALANSSGFAVLDEQALEMIHQAARLVSLPEPLRARNFNIAIPVQFALGD